MINVDITHFKPRFEGTIFSVDSILEATNGDHEVVDPITRCSDCYRNSISVNCRW